MILVLDGDEVREYLRYLAGHTCICKQETIVRPQTSGPCVHYGPYGCEVPREDGQCPHLDNASIVCPIKDVLGAAQTYAPAEPEFVEPEPDEDHAYAIQLPTPAKRKNAWTEDENWIVARADTWKEAIVSYRGRFPHSKRTDKAIRSRWEKLHTECRAPLTPDFAGDTVPVTQCEEPIFYPGDLVRLADNPDMVGEVVYVAANGRYVSVQFPGPGPAKVCAIDSIEGVGA
jgi:hypothetical protein